jgi:hypothetical protein
MTASGTSKNSRLVVGGRGGRMLRGLQRDGRLLASLLDAAPSDRVEPPDVVVDTRSLRFLDPDASRHYDKGEKGAFA